MASPTQVLNPPCQRGPPLLKGPQGRNEHRSSTRCTPFLLTKRYKECWDQTTLSSVSWPKYEGVPYPPDQHEKSSRWTRTSTLQYLGGSLMQYWRPPDESKTNMLSRKGFLKRPSTTSNEQVFRCDGSTQSNPLKRLHQGTKKTEEKSTSTSPARMGNDALPSGSSEWMGGKWPGIPKITHQGISPSSPTSSPPKNTTTTTTMIPWGPYQDGSYLPWWEAGPPSP